MRHLFFITLILSSSIFVESCNTHIEEEMLWGKWQSTHNDQVIKLWICDGNLLYWSSKTPNNIYKRSYKFDKKNNLFEIFYLSKESKDQEFSGFPSSFIVNKIENKLLTIQIQNLEIVYKKTGSLQDKNFLEKSEYDLIEALSSKLHGAQLQLLPAQPTAQLHQKEYPQAGTRQKLDSVYVDFSWVVRLRDSGCARCSASYG